MRQVKEESAGQRFGAASFAGFQHDKKQVQALQHDQLYKAHQARVKVTSLKKDNADGKNNEEIKKYKALAKEHDAAAARHLEAEQHHNELLEKHPKVADIDRPHPDTLEHAAHHAH